VTKDLKVITKQFFAAYDAHNVDGMLALCADGAQGRYVPYGKDSVIPINTNGKISRLDCYWDNTAINAIKASAL
jgi:ketosteroid isomerase-like protein